MSTEVETAAARMRRRLNATGSYRLTGETSGDWELNALGAGLDWLDAEAALLLDDLFPATASARQLDLWERDVRPQPTADTLAWRQAVQAARSAIHPGRFTPGDLPTLLRAAGVRGEAVEGDQGLQVILGRYLGVGKAEALLELDRLLPAHLPWSLDESVAWPALEAWDRSFDDWDSLGLTWSDLDQLTREELVPQKPAAVEDGGDENE